MYMGNELYWNHKFEARGPELMQPEKRLADDMPLLPEGGKALDLACGDGRNAVFLAVSGFNVTAVDFSSKAAERLRRFASEMKLDIEIQQKNLSEKESFTDLGKYDLIIINHYRLNPELYPILAQHLNQGGVLWVNGFYEVPEDNTDVKREDILTLQDFKELSKLSCEDIILYEIGKRRFIRGMWRQNT